VFEFKLPDLGEGIHEAEILKWHVKVGDRIASDDPLIDVQTDKATVTIPSPRTGTIAQQNGKDGDTLVVGQIVVVIDDGVGVKPAPAAPAAPLAAAKAPPAPVPVAAAAPVSVAGPVPAAPATRRLARELGVDINRVPPTGPAGRVTAEDVKRFAEGGAPAAAAPGAAPSRVTAPVEAAAVAAGIIPYLDIEPLPDFEADGPVERIPLRGIRRKVARKMTTSAILVPHVAHMDEADVTELDAFRRREREKQKDGPPLTLLVFVMKAIVAGLKTTPAFNSSVDPFKEEIIYKHYYNIGFAADTGRGLVVPVVHGAGCKSIRQLATDINDLAERAREDKLTVQEMRGGTFTITNIGPLGGTAMVPIINYPEVAILGMGRAQPKPVVRDGQIVIRLMLPLTLAFDHRVADGADAARFVSELARQISDPNLLLLES
jgi:pyruvate dehydrogenase E2 component (dihydrolipoamide acetyltransferase)